ncbi:MAG: hypothetical protein HYX78_00595 [Armatimonadetes bacterium]|nr:hypothetical protein [Armatimonadota bacterium]
MKIGIVVGALVLLLSLACMAIAADAPKVTLEAQSTPIQKAMDDVGKQAGVQILCDSDVKAAISAQFGSIELEKLLDAVTMSNNLKWQKLYLPDQSEQKPSLEKIKARAEAVAAVAGGTIVVCDPATGKQKVFVEQDAASPSVDPEKLGMKPVYLISKPKVETKDAEQPEQDAATRFQSLQNERMKLLAEMTPEQRINATQQEMMSMMNMDPATRQQIMMDQMSARRNMAPEIRDSYRQMMRETFRSMREQGLIPEGEGRQRGWGRGERRERER